MKPDDQLDVLQAFRVIDARLAAGPRWPSVLALRERLAGELLSEVDRVAGTLADDFELETVTGGSKTTTDRTALLGSIRRQHEAEGEAMMWMELVALVVEETAIAGQGTLHMLRAAPGGSAHITSIPLAFFIHFDGALMTSEVIFMDPPRTEPTVLGAGAAPTVEQVRTLLNQT
jgi:hypothetical protein